MSHSKTLRPRLRWPVRAAAAGDFLRRRLPAELSAAASRSRICRTTGRAPCLRLLRRLRADHRGPERAARAGRAVPQPRYRPKPRLRSHGRRSRPAAARRRYLLRGSRARGGTPPALRDRVLQPCLGNQFGAHHRGGRSLPRRTGGHRHAERFSVRGLPHSLQPGGRREADRHALDGCEPAACRGHHRRRAAAGASGQGRAGVPRGSVARLRSPTFACWCSMPTRQCWTG